MGPQWRQLPCSHNCARLPRLDTATASLVAADLARRPYLSSSVPIARPVSDSSSEIKSNQVQRKHRTADLAAGPRCGRHSLIGHTRRAQQHTTGRWCLDSREELVLEVQLAHTWRLRAAVTVAARLRQEKVPTNKPDLRPAQGDDGRTSFQACCWASM